MSRRLELADTRQRHPRNEAERKRKGQASRHQPFHGGPVVKAALKYYCLADANRSREPKNRTYKASRRQRFLGVPNSQTPNLVTG